MIPPVNSKSPNPFSNAPAHGGTSIHIMIYPQRIDDIPIELRCANDSPMMRYTLVIQTDCMYGLTKNTVHVHHSNSSA